jgi:hypothetical protein
LAGHARPLISSTITGTSSTREWTSRPEAAAGPELEADDVREALLFAAEAVRERAVPLAAGE